MFFCLANPLMGSYSSFNGSVVLFVFFARFSGSSSIEITDFRFLVDSHGIVPLSEALVPEAAAEPLGLQTSVTRSEPELAAGFCRRRKSCYRSICALVVYVADLAVACLGLYLLRRLFLQQSASSNKFNILISSSFNLKFFFLVLFIFLLNSAIK